MTKAEQLLSMLADWKTVHELTVMFEWQPHTLRAAISGIAKSHNVERQRIDGITSYRIAPQTQMPDNRTGITASDTGDCQQ